MSGGPDAAPAPPPSPPPAEAERWPRRVLLAVPRLLRHALWEQWAIVNAEAAAERRAAGYDDARRVDPRVLVILATAAVSLVLQEYFGDRGTYVRLAEWAVDAAKAHYGAHANIVHHLIAFRFGPYFDLGGYVYWALGRDVGYIVIPLLVIAFLPGVRARDCGLAWKGAHRHLWIYGALFLSILPLVVMMSYRPAFLETYPFYKNVSRSGLELVIWELAYFSQFLALELFFRGFLLHPLKRPLGAYAIFVMAVPYCMIHFGKPFPETMGAIVAGSVLGTLSLRTRSIWAGVLIHVSVAFSMDALALAHTNALPHHFWPLLHGGI